MCQPRGEGGRRCDDLERLKSCTSSDFAPEPTPDAPDVIWRNDDLQEVWGDSVDSRAAACAGLLEMERLKTKEPAITRSVQAAATAAGGSCAHLDFRMKSPASLVRKVRDKQETAARTGAPKSPEEIAGGLKDVVRYTVVEQNHFRLATTTEKTVRSLQDQGWEIREIKNTYSEGASYKGIHVIGTAPSGVTAEVQVHSADSLEVKNRNHGPYEIYRDSSRPKSERRAAQAECERNSASISTPEGLDKLTSIGGVNVSKT